MVSVLKQYARDKKKEETTVITARIPNSKYNWLKKYCDELGISINEAINLLIENEFGQQEKQEEEQEQEQEEEKEDSHKSIEELIKGYGQTQNRIYKGIYFDKDIADFLDNVAHGNKSEIVNKILRQYLMDNELM